MCVDHKFVREKDIQYWDGVCYVHEEYSPGMINNIRRKYEHVKVLAHPECDETILEKADYVGSTSQMVNHVKESSDPYYFLLTEKNKMVPKSPIEHPNKHQKVL